MSHGPFSNCWVDPPTVSSCGPVGNGTRWNRVRTGGVCLAATAAVLTACGSTNPPPGSPTTTVLSPSMTVASSSTAAAPAPSSTSTAAPTGTSSISTSQTPPSTTTQASPTACRTSGLRTGAAYYLADSLFEIFRVPLTNITHTACQTQGWPGVSFLDANGKDIGDAARVGSALQPQIVAAGSTVQVTITVSNPAGGDGCDNFNENAQSSTQLLLTPPNERDSLTVGTPQGRTVLVCHPRVFPIGSTSTTR